MLRRFTIAIILISSSGLLVSAAGKPKSDQRLVASWGQGGETLYTFRADGVEYSQCQ